MSSKSTFNNLSLGTFLLLLLCDYWFFYINIIIGIHSWSIFDNLGCSVNGSYIIGAAGIIITLLFLFSSFVFFFFLFSSFISSFSFLFFFPLPHPSSSLLPPSYLPLPSSSFLFPLCSSSFFFVRFLFLCIKCFHY